MAAIDFPTSPTNGQTFTSGDKTWIYSTTISAWNLQAQAVTGPTGPTGITGATGPTGASGPLGIVSSATAPVSPSAGQVWFNTSTGASFIYYNSAWVELGGGSMSPLPVTSSTRPSAPWEGQTIYETDTDLLYVYGGSAWQQVSGGTAVGNSGLVFVKSQTVGTAISSVTVSNCFSSLYDNYFITMSNGAVISNYGTYLRFSLAGVTTNLWYGAGYYMQNAATITGFNNAGTAYGYAGIGETGSYGFKIDIQSPFLTKQKDFMVQYIGGGTSTYSGIYNAHCNSSASCASFTITPEAGTMTGGVITVYGYRK